MRTYKNKKDELVSVSQEHLDTAIEIKLALQKDSNSNKCSWSKHRELMRKEGFYDSENSEAYRCMIKAYQSSIGKLPSAPKHADMVASKKIEAYKALVGEVTWEKQENQQYLKEIRKGKKEIIEQGLLIETISESIQEVFGDVNFDLPELRKANDNESRVIAVLSDWHIGALVDLEINQFNLEIAKRRASEFADEVIDYANRSNATFIDVVNVGDLVENIYMREQQGYETEFPLSKQITVGAKLIISFLLKLRGAGFETGYMGFSGNHDRLSKKDSTISGDTAVTIANEMIKDFIEDSKECPDGIYYYEADKYGANLTNVNGRNIKFRHGDRDAKNSKGKLAKHSQLDGVHYDIIAFGHYHHFEVHEVGRDEYEVYFGSLKGSDVWTDDNGWHSMASQGIISVDSNGKIDIKRVGLE